MKASEVPKEALIAPPTPIPTKVVNDWDALCQVISTQGFVIIESAEIITTACGGVECMPVKLLSNHVQRAKGKRLATKRISEHRWYCEIREKRNANDR